MREKDGRGLDIIRRAGRSGSTAGNTIGPVVSLRAYCSWLGGSQGARSRQRCSGGESRSGGWRAPSRPSDGTKSSNRWKFVLDEPTRRTIEIPRYSTAQSVLKKSLYDRCRTYWAASRRSTFEACKEGRAVVLFSRAANDAAYLRRQPTLRLLPI